MADPGRGPLPARHRERQRRRTMRQPPCEPRQHQHADRQPDRLVQVEPPRTRSRRALWDIDHPPAQRKLREHEQHDEPVQRNRDRVVARRVHSQNENVALTPTIPLRRGDGSKKRPLPSATMTDPMYFLSRRFSTRMNSLVFQPLPLSSNPARRFAIAYPAAASEFASSTYSLLE